MKLQLKRSNVLDGGKAKVPSASQMEYGELAVNYNSTDLTVFTKNDNGTVVTIVPPINQPWPTPVLTPDASGTGGVEVKGLMNFGYIPSLKELP